MLKLVFSLANPKTILDKALMKNYHLLHKTNLYRIHNHCLILLKLSLLPKVLFLDANGDPATHVVVVNGENAAHGKGLSQSTFNTLLSGGADIVTTGNHVWDNKDIMTIIDRELIVIV